MKDGTVDIEVKEDKTIEELLDELQFSTVPILLEIKGLVCYPDEIKGELRKGGSVVLIPIEQGGEGLAIITSKSPSIIVFKYYLSPKECTLLPETDCF